MRTLLITIFSLFIFLAANANNGQEATTQKTVKHQHFSPKKGFYAITNKADKLAKRGNIQNTNSNVAKGYYALQSNKNKIVVDRKGHANVKPVITKGYYAIGNNSNKLK